MSHPINPDAKNLEEAFFAKENQRLLQRLREKAEREERRTEFRSALGVDDDELLDHLEELGLAPETALALTLVPLACVAWADGDVSQREREAIVRAAEEHGVAAGSAAHDLLESWLGTRPDAPLVEAWKRYMRTIWSALDERERAVMRDRIMGTARGVAEASGGFLGLTSKVSAAERAALDDFEKTLA